MQDMTATAMSPSSPLIGRFRDLVGMLNRIPHDLTALVARLSIGAVFWQSGQTKVDGWQVTDSAVYLFENEYKLPLIDPWLAAHLAAFNEHFFQGHFPGAPVMPGVLQIEALAQVGAILALREFEDRDGKIPFFTGIESAKFRKPVVPGDTLELEVIALRIGSKVQKMKGIARVDGNITSEAEIMSIIADRPKKA